jgi:hypothetical protein
VGHNASSLVQSSASHALQIEAVSITPDVDSSGVVRKNAFKLNHRALTELIQSRHVELVTIVKDDPIRANPFRRELCGIALELEHDSVLRTKVLYGCRRPTMSFDGNDPRSPYNPLVPKTGIKNALLFLIEDFVPCPKHRCRFFAGNLNAGWNSRELLLVCRDLAQDRE